MAMVLFGISLVTFALTYLSPGDPVRTYVCIIRNDAK